MEKNREFKAYTYYLYHKPTGKKYYGVRWGNKCSPEQDLWNEYFSSSELVADLIQKHGKESFAAEVRKIFENGEDARIWEDRVLHRLKAPEREEWLNQAYSCGPFYANWNGKNHDEDTKQICRERALEIWKVRKSIGLEYKPHTEERKHNIREAKLLNGFYRKILVMMGIIDISYKLKVDRTGENNPMYNKHHRPESIELIKINKPDISGENNPMYNKHHTEETKNKIRIARLGTSQTKESNDKRSASLKEFNRKKREAKLQSALI
jgi:hypothetical protein